MARKRLLVDVDENQWAALKGQAELEGRFVRVLLAEAIGWYLARARADARLSPTTHVAVAAPVMPKPSVEDLRALVDAVATETPAQRRQRMAERQAYLRDHPEEEPQ